MDRNQCAIRHLDLLRASADKNVDISFKIRNWCITVWIASLGFVLSTDFRFSPAQKAVFPFAPIVAFWILDGFQNAFRILRTNAAIKLETALVSGNVEEIDANALMFFLAYEQIKYRDKIFAFFRALLTLETVLIFYVTLTLVTVVIMSI